MNKSMALVVVVLTAFPVVGSAQEMLDVHVRQMVRGVERGYARAMGRLDTNLRQPSARTLGDPFTLSPFTPRQRPDLSWQLQALDVNRSALCVTAQVSNVAGWNLAIRGFAKAGMQAVTSQECELSGAPRAYSTAPVSFPANIKGGKILSREDIPVPTVLPQVEFDPVFEGVDGTAVSRPGLELLSVSFEGDGYSDIRITNPALVEGYTDDVPAQPVYRRLTLSAYEIREGFVLLHDCDLVGPDETCTVKVRYSGAFGDYRVGSLRLTFSTGAKAIIGLLGRTQ